MKNTNLDIFLKTEFKKKIIREVLLVFLAFNVFTWAAE